MIDAITVILLIMTILFALLTIEVGNLLYAALCLCAMSITVGLLFGVFLAPLVMIFQLLIYAGATIALFLSVIVLTRRED